MARVGSEWSPRGRGRAEQAAAAVGRGWCGALAELAEAGEETLLLQVSPVASHTSSAVLFIFSFPTAYSCKHASLGWHGSHRPCGLGSPSCASVILCAKSRCEAVLVAAGGGGGRAAAGGAQCGAVGSGAAGGRVADGPDRRGPGRPLPVLSRLLPAQGQPHAPLLTTSICEFMPTAGHVQAGGKLDPSSCPSRCFAGARGAVTGVQDGTAQGCSVRLHFHADGLLWMTVAENHDGGRASRAAQPSAAAGAAATAAAGADSQPRPALQDADSPPRPALEANSEAVELPPDELELQPMLERLAADHAMVASLPAPGSSTPGLWLHCTSLTPVLAALLRHLGTIYGIRRAL